MKKLAKGIIIPALLTMVACEPLQLQKKEEKKNNTLPKKMTTAQLAGETESDYIKRQIRMAEILAQSPIGFPHAARTLDFVLKIAPNNDKALFYSASLDLIMSYEGIGYKAEPLVDNKEDYALAVKELKEKGYPEWSDFLLNKKGSQYNNYRSVQKDLLSNIQNGFKKAIKKLNKIDQDVELVLTQIKADTKEIEYNCVDYSDEYGDYTECDLKEEMVGLQTLEPKKKIVDQADVKSIVGMLKGYLNYTRLYSAYSIEGAEEIGKRQKALIQELGRELTDEENDEIISSASEFMTLTPENELGDMVNSLTEMVEIAMDLDALGDKLCDAESRKNNLIGQICLGEGFREGAVEILSYLEGPKEHTLGLDSEGNLVTIMVDLPAFLKNPVKDLKATIYDATAYDSNGSSRIAKEPKLNGLFPNNDLLEKLKSVVEEL